MKNAPDPLVKAREALKVALEANAWHVCMSHVEDALAALAAQSRPAEPSPGEVTAREMRDWFASRPGASYVATIADIDEALATMPAPARPTAGIGLETTADERNRWADMDRLLPDTRALINALCRDIDRLLASLRPPGREEVEAMAARLALGAELSDDLADHTPTRDTDCAIDQRYPWSKRCPRCFRGPCVNAGEIRPSQEEGKR